MYPVKKSTISKTHVTLFPLTARMSMKLFVLCLVAASVAVALSVRVDSKDSTAAITVQAAGRGGQSLNFQDGRAMEVEYRGDQFSSQALQSGAARARALASVDIDDNGTPDLLAGYANNGSGILTIQRGNNEAFAPTDDSIFPRIQAGYNPDSLSSIAEIYQVPEPADFVVTGDFNRDAVKDVLVAARGGGAYLLAGDGQGGLTAPRQISLSGSVTAVAAAEFGMSDGKADLAVGVFGTEGPSLLIFPSTEGGLSAPLSFPLKGEATAIQFGNLDQDPFLDVAVAAGNEIEIIHGWGRVNFANVQSRVERIDVPNTLRGLAVGNFIWDRDNRTEIAAQSAEGTISILQLGNLDTQPFSPEEVAVRVRMRGKVTKQTDAEILAAPSWPAAKAERWNTAKDLGVTGVVGGAESSQGLLVSFHISWQQTDELLVLDAGQNKLKIFQQADAGVQAIAGSTAGELSTTSLDVTSAPVAVTALPRKLNGERDLVLLGSDQSAASIVPLAPTAIFNVTKTADTNDGTCGADCSLREAVVAANASPGSTVNVPAGTYQLTINGTAEGGFCQSPGTGDLDISGNNTTITGAGSATTIIQQTQPNDRVLCVDQALAGNFTFNMSGVTITGGRETFAVGGGGMVSGAANNSTTVSACVFSNSQSSGGSGPGGGGINNLGGSLTVTNCTVGGTSAPGASQLVVAQANSCSVSGGGLSHSPGDPLGRASNGVLTVTGTTFQNNTAASGAAGGGGADVFTHNLGTGSHSFATSTFLSNKATVGNGGGIIIESLTCTVATTAFTTNAAQGASSHGGGIQVTGGGLVLNGTSPTITFSGNTATIAGSSVTAGSTVNVSGTNTTIGGDIEIPTNGTWTNNAGSALSPTNVVISGGTFNMNNSTMTVTGNLTLGPGPAVGGTFNGNTGTVNIAGNFTANAGGAGPVTTFNAGTGTFNFNGAGAQAINGTLSPTFNNLTVNKGGGSLTLGINVGVASNLTVTAGTFDLSTFTANRTALGGTLTVSNGATLRFQSATLPTNYSTYTLGATSTVEYYGAGAQTIAAVNYGNLTSSSTGARTLANAGTIGIAGVFTPGTNAYTITGSTIDFNGSVAQTIPAFNYNNLTSSNTGARTLANAGTIGIAGVFTPGTNAYTITGSTINFNGAGAQTIPAFNYNNLTSSSTGARTLAGAGTIGIQGVFTPGTNAYTITGSTIDFNGGGAQTIPAFNYNNLTSSNTGARTLANAGTIGIAGVFTPGTNAYTITGSTINFNGAGAQTIPAFNYNNLTSSSTGARTLPNGSTIGIAGIFTPGTNVYTITGNTIDFNGSGVQTIPAFNYNNLTSSNTGARTLANAGTIGIANVFTIGTNTYTITGSTIDFNGSVAQTIPAFNYNNLTSSNTGARTLANTGTIGIAGTFTPGTNVYTITGSTVAYNGSAAQFMPASFTTYNNLTLNNITSVTGFAGLTVQGLLRVQAGTFTSSSIYNNVQIDLGATMVATAGSTINVSGNWTNNGTFTPSTGTVVFNGNNNTQTLAGNTTFNNLTLSHTGTGGVQGTIGTTLSVAGNWISNGTFTPNGNTVNFNGAGAQTISGSATTQTFDNFTVNKTGGSTLSVAASTNTLDINGNVTLTLGTFAAGTATAITVAGNWANTGTFTSGGGTVTFDGADNTQTLSGNTTFNNLTINHTGTGGVTASGSTLAVTGLLEVQGGTFTSSSTFNNVQIDSGATLAGTNATTMNVSGNWTNNGGSPGSFTANGNTVNFNGAGAQTIGGNTATTFNNLTIANAGAGVSLALNATVNGTLTLTNDLNTAANTLIQPSTAPVSAGAGDVIGNVQRTNSPSSLPLSTVLTFGNTFNRITFDSGTPPTDVTVNLVKTGPGDFPTAVTRTYTITPNGGAAFTSTLQLHYLDAELNGNTEFILNLWRKDGATWNNQGAFNHDPINNWVRQVNVTQFSPWTFANGAPTGANGLITGRITDDAGNPVEGAVVKLSGTQSRKFITDANGVYLFDNVETNGFYTVTPSRANYSFNPTERSFSPAGQTTEATFGATLASSGLVNPLDTPEYFVRQHYVDFLGREPDEAGFNFWSDQMNECGADTNCSSRRRENVSAAYFLSIEFQKTGGLVDKLYRASFGSQPSFAQFMPDARTVGQGVQVGKEGWEELLLANELAFVNAFVNRPAFLAVYGSMDSSQYVDTLISHTGVAFSVAERDGLVSGLVNGTQTRADTLRSIAEDGRFVNAKFNETFVMMEYYGYLRRDYDASGYAFWLNKLNQFNGNFEQAEMVKAFIVSGEYRDRFPR